MIEQDSRSQSGSVDIPAKQMNDSQLMTALAKFRQVLDGYNLLAGRSGAEQIGWPTDSPYTYEQVMIKLARTPILGSWKDIKEALKMWQPSLTTISGATGGWIGAIHAISQGRTNNNVADILKGFNSDAVAKENVKGLFEREAGNMKVSNTVQVVQNINDDAGSYQPSVSGDSKSSVGSSGSNLSFGNINMGPGVKSALNTFAQYFSELKNVGSKPVEAGSIDKMTKLTPLGNANQQKFTTAYFDMITNKPVSKMDTLLNQQRVEASALYSARPDAKWTKETGWMIQRGTQFKAVKKPERKDERSLAVIQKGAGDALFAGLTIPMIKVASQALKKLGFAEIGSISKQGLPIYLGRYRDPKTKKIKVLAKPRAQYDKTNAQAVKLHQLTMLGYLWNKMARQLERTTKVIKSFGNWDSVVNKIERQNTLPMLKKEAVKNILKSIYGNTESTFYNQLKALLGPPGIQAFKDWKYEPIAKLIQKGGNAMMAKPTIKASPILLKAATRLANFSLHVLLKKYMLDQAKKLVFVPADKKYQLTEIPQSMAKDQYTEMEAFNSKNGVITKKVDIATTIRSLQAQKAEGKTEGVVRFELTGIDRKLGFADNATVNSFAYGLEDKLQGALNKLAGNIASIGMNTRDRSEQINKAIFA